MRLATSIVLVALVLLVTNLDANAVADSRAEGTIINYYATTFELRTSYRGVMKFYTESGTRYEGRMRNNANAYVYYTSKNGKNVAYRIIVR